MDRENRSSKKSDTSWQRVHNWYNEAVGAEGHYYHQAIVLPKTLQLLHLNQESELLDLACGQGVLSRAICTPIKKYIGIDASKNLISHAQKAKKNHETFLVADATQTLPLDSTCTFSHAAIILAIQNIKHPREVFLNLRPHMRPGSRLVIVMNHPYFRIPRQTQWGIDTDAKLQYRRVNVYMSSQEIPICIYQNQTKNRKQEHVWSFHYPLSMYTAWLKEAGFVIEVIEEWCSDKKSTGAQARMENRARNEFPLFMALSTRFIH